MNICLLSKNYLQKKYGGGIGSYAHNLAKTLTNFGNNVHIITQDKMDEDIKIEGAFLHKLKVREFKFRGSWRIKKYFSKVRMYGQKDRSSAFIKKKLRKLESDMREMEFQLAHLPLVFCKSLIPKSFKTAIHKLSNKAWEKYKKIIFKHQIQFPCQ